MCIDISRFCINSDIMRTTIDISDAILGDLRRLANQSNRSFKDVVSETLQRGLANNGVQQSKKRITVKPQAVGIKPAIRAMSMNQLYDQIEAQQ